MGQKVFSLIFRAIPEGFPALGSAMNAVNAATTQTTTSMTGLNNQAKQIPPTMTAASSSSSGFSGALGNVRNSSSAVEGPLNKNNILVGQSAVSFQSGAKGADVYTGSVNKVQDTIVPMASKIGGMAFLFAGLTASMGEAAGMQEILALSQQKVNELTDVQTALMEQGLEGTDLYASVTKELEQAQRALTRQQTITNLSTQDQSFYILSLASIAMPQVIKGITSLVAKSKELGGGFTGLASVITSKLSTGFVSMSERLHIIPEKFNSAGKSANTFGGALRGLALNPFMLAITAIVAVLGIFASNMFGVRDAVNAFGVQLGNQFPILKGLLTWLGQAGDAITVAFGGSIRQVSPEVEKAKVTIDSFRTSVRDLYADVAAKPNFALLPMLLDFDAALLKVHQTGRSALPEVNKLLADLWSSNKAPSDEFRQKITDISLQLIQMTNDGKLTINEMAQLAAMIKEAALASDQETKALEESNKALGLAADGTKTYSGNVEIVAKAIEATGVVQDELVKGLDETQKSMFDVANATGLTGDALKNYLENVEASSGSTKVFGEDIVRLNDGSVDLIATINKLTQQEKTHLEGAKTSWAGIVGAVEAGLITYDGARIAIQAIADTHDIALQHFETYAQNVIDGNIKVSDAERKLIDILVEKGVISVDTETETQTAIDETNKKIDEQIAELNLSAQAVGLNTAEKEALINVTEEEQKAYDEVNEKLQQLASARGADVSLLDEENAILRLFIETSGTAAITTEEVANATTLLVAGREEDARATKIQEQALANYLDSLNLGIDTTNLTVEGMNKMIQSFDDIGNATRIATSDVAAWHVELKAQHEIDIATYKALDDLALRYGITIPEAIKQKGIPAIKEFIENMLGTAEAARRMKEETTKAFNEMATKGQEMIGNLIDEEILDADAKKISKILKKMGLEADELTATQRILTVAIDDTDFKNDLTGLNDIMREEFGRMQGFAVEDANQIASSFGQQMQDTFGDVTPNIGDAVNQIWEYVKSTSPAGATGDFLLNEFGKAMEDPSIVQKALDGSLVQPTKQAGVTAGTEIQNEAGQIPDKVAQALNAGKGVIQNAAVVSIKDPVTGEIKQIPIQSQTELSGLEGVFSAEFVKASSVATGQINLILASIVFTMRQIKEEVATNLTEMTGSFNDFATNVAVPIDNISLKWQLFGTDFTKTKDVVVEDITAVQQAFSDLSSNVDTYMSSMTANVAAFADNAGKSFDATITKTDDLHSETSELSKNWATYMKSMAGNADSMANSVSDSLDNVIDKFVEAEREVADFIKALNAIPKKVTVEIQQKFTSTGTKYFAQGGSFLVTSTTHIGDKIVGEAGPEIVTVTPLTGKGSKDTVSVNVGMAQGIIGNNPIAATAGPGIRGGGPSSQGPVNITVSGTLYATLRSQSGRVQAEEIMPFLMTGNNAIT